jgi:hypothetical protein
MPCLRAKWLNYSWPNPGMAGHALIFLLYILQRDSQQGFFFIFAVQLSWLHRLLQ